MSTNLYSLFRRLIPVAALQVGDVLSIANGEAIISLPQSGQIRARGTAEVGDRVWVRDGLIEGLAPTLPIEVGEI